MRWQDIAAALDASPVAESAMGGRQCCDTCGGPVQGYQDGRPVVCVRCVADELGTTPYGLRLASEFHLSIKSVEARLQRFGGPNVSPREWLTPKSRLRK